MIQKLILIFILTWVMLCISNTTKKNGFNKLNVKRELINQRIYEGDVFSIMTTVENNKRLPISFLVLDEIMPKGINFKNEVISYKYGSQLCHISRYNIGWYERRKRTYELVADKRGTYILKNMQITVGDIFGLSAESKETENYLEILVYPKIKDIAKLKFDATNFQGNNTVKRWILKDTLYIKGIREYSVEDRMKDIHWKTSLKMDKLMVKDYDTTSDKKIIIILNVQCGDPAWSYIFEESIENGVKVSVALAKKAIKEGFATGLWTNANVVSMNECRASEVAPDLKAFKRIMELAARIDTSTNSELYEYLKQRAKKFDKDATYILVTPFLNEKSRGEIIKLHKMGFRFKIIDVSANGDVPCISGIEKITYKGEEIV